MLRKRYDGIAKNVVYNPIEGFGRDTRSHFLPGIHGKLYSVVVVAEKEMSHSWQYIPDPKDLSVLYLFKDIIEMFCELCLGFMVVDAAQGFIESEKGSSIVFRDKGL